MSDTKQNTDPQVKATGSLEGRVTSNRMEKTITVLVSHREKHPLYGKYMTRTTKLHAHDEDNGCQIGDLVRISQCRPISKNKSWKLDEIIERAEQLA